jgi:hypothetical protein
MMKHGLAVLIFTDLSQQFDMDSDSAIGDLLDMGYCRYDKPQSKSTYKQNVGGATISDKPT